MPCTIKPPWQRLAQQVSIRLANQPRRIRPCLRAARNPACVSRRRRPTCTAIGVPRPVRVGTGRPTQALIDAVMESAPDGRAVSCRRFQRLAQHAQRQDAQAWAWSRYSTSARRTRPWATWCAPWRGARRNADPVPARTFPAARPWFRLDRIYCARFKGRRARDAWHPVGKTVGPRPIVVL